MRKIYYILAAKGASSKTTRFFMGKGTMSDDNMFTAEELFAGRIDGRLEGLAVRVEPYKAIQRIYDSKTTEEEYEACKTVHSV